MSAIAAQATRVDPVSLARWLERRLRPEFMASVIVPADMTGAR
jgi:hypothetical protein